MHGDGFMRKHVHPHLFEFHSMLICAVLCHQRLLQLLLHATLLIALGRQQGCQLRGQVGWADL